MTYFTDLFSPSTYQAFRESDQSISGFRIRHRRTAERVKVGDRLICYLTELSRWFGLLEVIEGPYLDDSPIFVSQDDPFVVRFRVRCVVLLSPEHSISIHEHDVWSSLSFTRDLPVGSPAWTGKVRGSLTKLEKADGEYLANRLLAQTSSPIVYSLTDRETRKLTPHKVSRADKVVSVTVPEDVDEVGDEPVQTEVQVRESIQIQGLLAEIGSKMGMSIWIPKADRMAILKEFPKVEPAVLERLPLNYDDTTLRTIEQIDVIWLQRRSIVRAFEVEHTTSVYSGILRMADLLALQPNMDIKVHIVAPDLKREKVMSEIRRPVFSLLEKGPLAESCSFLSYSSLRELNKQRHIEHLAVSVLDEYSEEAE